jgi:hypothetical protein
VIKVTFVDYRGKTKLSILYELKSAAEKKALIKVQMIEGWNTSLDKYVDYIRKL